MKVDDIANRCGICIRPLDESLYQNFSGMASLDKDSGDKVVIIIQMNLQTDNDLL